MTANRSTYGNRVTLRILAGTLLALALGAPAAAPAAAATGLPTGASCRIVALPLPAGTWRSEVTAGDPTGRYLIGTAFVAGRSDAVPLRWDRGRLAPLPPLPGATSYNDVNADGTVVGTVSTASQTRGWLYRNGRYTVLRGLTPTDSVQPYFVDARGDVLGLVEDTSGAQPGEFSMVFWRAHRTQPRQILAPGPTNLVGLDDDRTIVGSAFLDIYRSYIWPRGGSARVLRGPSGVLDFGASGIQHGWVSGTENVTSQPSTAVAWNLRTGEVHRFTGPNFGAVTVNGRGDILLARGFDSTALAHRDGHVVTLPGPAGSTTLGARVLSDRGVAAGWARSGNVFAAAWYGC